MTESFLDRLDTQLVNAEQALFATAGRRRAIPRWRAPRRSIVATVLVLAVAGPAVAITRPWPPILGRPALHDTPLSTSNTAVPRDAAAILGVLRRPQTAYDRGPTTDKLLRGVGQEFAGVRLPSVRLVTLARGHDALVISATGVGLPARGEIDIADPLCLEWSDGGTCGSLSSLRAHGIIVAGGPRVLGLVPDGVATVALSFASGRTLSAAVHDNTFYLTTAPTTRPAASRSPVIDGHHLQPPLTTTRFTVQWLDSTGHDIGRPRTP
jgi:hypothetical protein